MTSPLAKSLTAKFAVVSLNTSQGTASTQPLKALQFTETLLSSNNTSRAFRQPASPKYQSKQAVGMAATKTRLLGAEKQDSQHTKETFCPPSRGRGRPNAAKPPATPSPQPWGDPQLLSVNNLRGWEPPSPSSPRGVAEGSPPQGSPPQGRPPPASAHGR